MQHRSVLKMIILTIVTLGIYQLFWTYWTNQEMRAKGARVLPVKLLFAPLLLLIGVALMQFLFRFLLTSTDTTSTGASVAINLISVVAGILAIVLIVPLALYWYYRYSQALEQVTDKQITFGFSFGLLVLCYVIGVSFIWPFIIQYRLNEIFTGPSVTDAPYPAA